MVAAYGGRPFRRLQSIDAIPDSGYLSACSVHHRNGRFVRHGRPLFVRGARRDRTKADREK
jgi:hypothetical protein